MDNDLTAEELQMVRKVVDGAGGDDLKPDGSASCPTLRDVLKKLKQVRNGQPSNIAL